MKPTKQGNDGQKSFLKMETLVTAMKGWSIRFKDRQPNQAEMTFLAKEFFQDLTEEKVTTDEFMAADRHVRKTNKFFPVMADILAAVEEHRDSEYNLYRAQRKWIVENEWRKNYPETLTADQAELLGVTVGSIEASAQQGFMSQEQMRKMIAGCVKSIE